MITDPLADYLTRIRNATKAKHTVVEIPGSRIKKQVTQILCEQGYLKKYQLLEDQGYQGTIRIYLKYDPKTKNTPFIKLIRVSKPGRRIYRKSNQIPHVLNGLGITILTTPQGVMTGKEARRQGIGGEEICHVY